MWTDVEVARADMCVRPHDSGSARSPAGRIIRLAWAPIFTYCIGPPRVH